MRPVSVALGARGPDFSTVAGLCFPNPSSPPFACGKSSRTEMGHIRNAAPPPSIGDFACLHLLAGEPAGTCANWRLSANGIR